MILRSVVFEASKFERIWFSVPEVKISHLLRILGYRENQNIKPIIKDAALTAIDRLKVNCTPQGVFCLQEIQDLGVDKLVLVSGIEFKCPVFECMLAESTHIISFVITLGDEIDKKIASYSKDVSEPLASLFLETASRLCLEQVLRVVRSKLIKYALSNEMSLGNRLAPGYSYKLRKSNKKVMWRLEEQRKLFDTFQDFDLPVELMESFTIFPRMSRSGIFGLQKEIIDRKKNAN